MVKLTLSRFGLTLSGAFLVLYFVCLYAMYRGNWEAIFVIYFSIFPISILNDEFCQWLRSMLGFSHETKILCELTFSGIIGLFEYYIIGMFLGRFPSHVNG